MDSAAVDIPPTEETAAAIQRRELVAELRQDFERLGARLAAIEREWVYSHEIVSGMDCAICLGTLEEGHVTRTQCCHMFHETCWRDNIGSCPLCRRPVTPAACFRMIIASPPKE